MNISTIISLIENKFESFLSIIVNYMPRIGIALLLFLIGISVAYLARVLVKKLIIGLKETAIGQLFRRWMFDLEKLAWWVGQFIFWTIFLFTLSLMSEMVNLTIISRWFTEIAVYLPKILLFGIFFAIGMILGRPVKERIVSFLEESGITTPMPLGVLAQYFIVAVFTLIGLAQMKIDVWFIFALILVLLSSILGGIMLAMGLGAREIVSNFLSTYHLQKKLMIGQKIKVSELTGTIININATSINLETHEGEIIIPGKVFAHEYCLIYKGK